MFAFATHKFFGNPFIIPLISSDDERCQSLYLDDNYRIIILLMEKFLRFSLQFLYSM
jgi:hypothetical protein